MYLKVLSELSLEYDTVEILYDYYDKNRFYEKQTEYSREYTEALRMADKYLGEGKYRETIEAVDPFIDKGYKNAFAYVGDVYRVTDMNKEAFYFYVKGMPSGRAMFGLGILYLNGSSDIPKNIEKAIRFINFSSEMGYRPAINRMGEFYYSGEYITKDVDAAFMLWEEAVGKGYGPALRNLCTYSDSVKLLDSKLGMLCESNGYGNW
jgi:TPR repeat protein